MTSGPVFDEHVVACPPRFHVIAPVGATEPTTPVTVAVNVIGAPNTLVKGVPTTVIDGVTWPTETDIGLELAAS